MLVQFTEMEVCGFVLSHEKWFKLYFPMSVDRNICEDLSPYKVKRLTKFIRIMKRKKETIYSVVFFPH